MYATLKIERNPITSNCLQCGRPIHKSNSAIIAGEGKLCSWECKTYYQVGKNRYHNGIAKYPHYYSRPDWKEQRINAMKRDNYICQDCGLHPKNHSRLQVHHLKRRILGGTDELDNLITLCFACHKKRDGRLY
jgi:5-methylcytosine-specific restriction endonuclease McrA